MKRWLLVLLGTAALFLGIVGVLLPIIPGTPFLVLAFICFGKGSRKIHALFLRVPFLGKHLERIERERSLTRGEKFFTIFSMVIYLSIAVYLLSLIAVKIFLLCATVFGSYWIAYRVPTKQK